MSQLRSLLDHDRVGALADDRFFARGQRYAAEDRVRTIEEDDTAIAGTVSGTHDYEVRIWAENDDLAYACDCPIGVDGTFCKHLVALAVAWLGESADRSSTKRPDPRPSRDRPRPITMADVRAYLEGQHHGTLVEMILAEADRDNRLRERLLLRTTMAATAGVDAGQIRRAIDRAVRAGDFVEYAGAHDFAPGIHDAIDLVEALLRDGQPLVVIELCEHALGRVERAIESVDDSDGEMGGLLERLQELHLAACRAARPDPEELAARLFAWELGDEWDVFGGAPETYADVLGTVGLAAYRRLAETEWAKVPALGPGSGGVSPYSSRRFRVTSIMESLARAAGDLDELVTVKVRDLSSAYRFLEIAQVCRDAGREDAALDWAERGVRAFPTATDSRLREFLAELYHHRSRHDEAMALIWPASSSARRSSATSSSSPTRTASKRGRPGGSARSRPPGRRSSRSSALLDQGAVPGTDLSTGHRSSGSTCGRVSWRLPGRRPRRSAVPLRSGMSSPPSASRITRATRCRSTSGRSTRSWRRSATRGTRRPSSSSGASGR